MSSKIQLMTPLLLAVLAVSTGKAEEPLGPPRGQDILSGASACGAGPIGQISKAGSYNPLCKTLTEAEKCLALIKGRFNSDYNLDPIAQGEPNTHKETLRIMAEFCVEQFRHELLGE